MFDDRSIEPPLLLPYEGKDVPHGVIEVNQKCNISCTACYKNKFNYTKPLDEIKADIDVMLKERTLSSVTLAGGEPTLHPELDEVIRYASGKGIAVQILTNGYQLDDEKIRRYKEAGLTKLYLHIDSLQTRPDAPKITRESDLNELRDRIGRRVTAHGLECALVITLYQDNLRQIEDLINFVLENPHFSRLLVTCCTDFHALGERFAKSKPAEELEEDPLAGMTVLNAEVEEALATKCGMYPYAYLGSTKSREERRWIFFYAMVIRLPDGTQHTLKLTPHFKHVVNFAHKLSVALTGKYPFGKPMTERRAQAATLLHGVLSRKPSIAWESVRFLRHSLRSGAQILPKLFVFQQGPNLTADGEIEYCRNCPDATVRDGKLVPVCTVDLVDPDKAASFLKNSI